MTFAELYQRASAYLNPREVSPFITAGHVGAALLTEAGHVYTGVSIDTRCALGMCAERNAIANMLTHGESRISRLVCVRSDGSLASPCGACREFLMQLHRDNGQMEILQDLTGFSTVTLNELLPRWWGRTRFE